MTIIGKIPTAKLTGRLWSETKDLEFESVFCPFCGKGAAALLFKDQCREVIATDVMATYSNMARALLENDSTTLDQFESESIIGPSENIVQNLEGLAAAYGLPAEFGAWLDRCRANICHIDHDYKKAVALTIISRVIFYMFSFSAEKRIKMTEDDWNQVYRYYVTSTNEAVFSIEQSCLAYDRDANALVGEVETDAMYFYQPGRAGVVKPGRTERFAELFNRACSEKELNSTLAGLVPSGLGSRASNNADHLENLLRFVESARHIPVWIIAANDSLLSSPNILQDLLSEFRRHIRMLQKRIVYSKKFHRDEYLFICSD